MCTVPVVLPHGWENRPVKLAEITRLARSASPKHATVRNALIGSAAAGGLALVYNFAVNDSFDPVDSVAVGVAAFLGWAIARELDPDYSITGLVALAVAALLAVWQSPALLLSAIALGGLRLLVGTVGGGGPTALDRVVMVGLAAYAATQPEGWVLVGVIAVAMLIAEGTHQSLWTLAVVAFAAGSALIWGGAPDNYGLAYGVVPLLLIIVILLALPVSPAATTDIGKQPLSPQRLRTGRILGGLAVFLSVFVSGGDGLTTLAPLTGAVVATALSVVFWGRQSPQTVEVS